MKHSKQAGTRALLISFVVVVCALADQLSKNWALENLVVGQPTTYIPGILRLSLTSNPGAAFSLGSQNGQIMGALALVLSIAILGWIVKKVILDEPLPVVEQIGLGCLLGGAIGNLIDRFNRGQVTDFLEFAFMTFPVFNVADALIDVGIVCLFISMYMGAKHEKTSINSEVEASSH